MQIINQEIWGICDKRTDDVCQNWCKTTQDSARARVVSIFPEGPDGKSLPNGKVDHSRQECIWVDHQVMLEACHTLNLQIGMITAQWNVEFDNWFSTVTTQPDDLPDFNAVKWAKMFWNECMLY